MKPPAFQFYVRDWLTDTELGQCSEATRGIWIDCLCNMWLAPKRGRLSRITATQFAQLCRTNPERAATAMCELKRTKTADVAERNGHFTITCRRMFEDERQRKSNADRKKQQRDKRRKGAPMSGQCPADVTPSSASASASALKKEERPPTPTRDMPETPDAQAPEVKPHETTDEKQDVAYYAGMLRSRIVLAGNMHPPKLRELTGIFNEKVGRGFALSDVARCCKPGGVDASECASYKMAVIAIKDWFKAYGAKGFTPKVREDDQWLERAVDLEARHKRVRRRSDDAVALVAGLARDYERGGVDGLLVVEVGPWVPGGGRSFIGSEEEVAQYEWLEGKDET